MSVEYEGLTFTHLGHASVRIERDDGFVIYIDPWSEVIEGLPHDADLVLVTHDDFDHYDPTGIDAVSSSVTDLLVYEGVDTSELALPVSTLSEGESLVVQGVAITAVPAYNRSDGDHVDENGDPFHAVGEVIGVVLTLNGTTVYFPSDTDFLDEHLDNRADVFIPPIGGTYTMDRHEAAEFATSVEASLVLPVHYDTFEAIETDAEAFVDDIESRGMRAELF